jgi:hypothetical protein
LAFADPSTPTVFDIFEELGLKLDLQKGPIETIMLLSVQRSSENQVKNPRLKVLHFAVFKA